MPIIIRRTVAVVPPAVRAAYWRGAPYLALLQDTGADMGDQARVNVERFGGPGGDYPQLEGFNQNLDRSKKINRLKATVAGGGVGAVVARRRLVAEQQAQAQHSRARGKLKDARRQSREADKKAAPGAWAGQVRASLRLQALILPHSGYARRKAAGKTPGHGMFGPDVRLRDTGALYANLDGAIRYVASGARVSLVARGRLSGRPSNQSLLEFHALGMGNNPVRNPAKDMGLFLARTQRRWSAFVQAAPGVGRQRS